MLIKEEAAIIHTCIPFTFKETDEHGNLLPCGDLYEGTMHEIKQLGVINAYPSLKIQSLTVNGIDVNKVLLVEKIKQLSHSIIDEWYT